MDMMQPIMRRIMKSSKQPLHRHRGNKSIFSTTFRLFFITIFIFSIFISGCSADELLKRQLVETVGSIDSPAFEKYEEIKVLHEQTLITVQALPVTSITSSTSNWVNMVAGTNGVIRGFEELTTLTSDDNPESHKKALDRGRQITGTVKSLKSYSQAEKSFIPMIAKMGLDHFFKEEGEFFEELADNESNTARRIEYLDNSYIAYSLAGDITKTSYLDLKIKETKSEYSYDMKIVERELVEGNESLHILRQSVVEKDKVIPVVEGIIASRSAKDSYSQVYALYVKHGDDGAESMNMTLSEINIATTDLENAFTKYMVLLVVLFNILIIYALYSLYTWKHEVDDTRLGDEVIR